MRHLATRLAVAGPAPHATSPASVLFSLVILAGVVSTACGETGEQPLWLAYSSGQVSREIWAPYPGERPARGVNLAETVFGRPSLEADCAGLATRDQEGVFAVRQAGFVDGDWFDSGAPSASQGERWSHQVLPDGLIYRSYLAGIKESRFAGQWVHDTQRGWMWDITLGGRVGILRYGTTSVDHPEGWQIDIEGAGMPRLDLERAERDLISSDFRFGIPLTYGRGNYQTKLAYYHLSSHLGDEYMVRHNTLQRRNYSRDVIVWGHSYFLTEDIRLYGEAGWAFQYDGGAEPWEFQVGVDYSPARLTGHLGAPFVAVNGYLRQEFDFGGSLVVQTGWQWRGYSGHLFRIGMHYFQGMSDQWEFFDQFEDKLGFGVWYDF
ncbi:MAG: DUF1207 domain-containing protein [Planctomycetaceae bacterium]|nr:DUF1207 domain-containing protein [Planctomycetaceae bacterium]